MNKKLFCILALCCGTAHAEFYTGNDLYERLTSSEFIPKSFGSGFVAGVTDALNGVLTCPPYHVTIEQAKDIVLLYLQSNPQSRHLTAAELIAHALSKTWPCKKGSKL